MRFKVTVAYDGTYFNGWQKQKDVRTVQSEIEQAIAKVEQRQVQISASGRTDAGVHAMAQVFHFDSAKALDENDWLRALNGLTPADIHILDVKSVAKDFHARFDAQFKTYQYRINTGQYNVFERNYAFQYGRKIAIESMKQAAKCFLGTHDFTSFNATALNEIADQTRMITEIIVQEEFDTVIITITGTGFLRYMVRIIVGCLIAVSEEKLTTEAIKQLINEPQKGVLPYKAPGHGLYLIEVSY